MQLSEDLLLIEKTENHNVNQKKSLISRGFYVFHFIREFAKFYEIKVLDAQIECNTCNKLLQSCIKIEEGRIVTGLYCTTKDGHQHIHFESYHSKYITKPLIFNH